MDWLVVGLGNPGLRYVATWHNLGFEAVDRLAAALGVRVQRHRFRALTAEATLGGQRILLMKPETFMNASGEAVREAASFYRIPPERILVFSDDFDLPLGQIRIRAEGSAGSHNGLKSVIQCLGSAAFPRVRIGFGPKRPGTDCVDFVLAKIPIQERDLADEGIQAAAEAAGVMMTESVAAAQSRWNHKHAGVGSGVAPRSEQVVVQEDAQGGCKMR